MSLDEIIQDFLAALQQIAEELGRIADMMEQETTDEEEAE